MSSQAERNKIVNFRKGAEKICYICNKKLLESNVTVDHVIPTSRGGLTESENLAICCKKHNEEKADMTKEEYNLYIRAVDSLFANNSTLTNLKNLVKNMEMLLSKQSALKTLLSDLDSKIKDMSRRMIYEDGTQEEELILLREYKSLNREKNRAQIEFDKEKSAYKYASSQKSNVELIIANMEKDIISRLRSKLNIHNLKETDGFAIDVQKIIESGSLDLIPKIKKESLDIVEKENNENKISKKHPKKDTLRGFFKKLSGRSRYGYY